MTIPGIDSLHIIRIEGLPTLFQTAQPENPEKYFFKISVLFLQKLSYFPVCRDFRNFFPVLFLLKLSCAVFHWQFFLQIFQNPSVPLVDFSMDQQKLWIFADLQQKSANGKLIFPELPRFPKIFQFFRSTEPSEKESATPRLESSYFIMNPITLISF